MTAPFETGGILRDDALLDALGRGELPVESHDDSTARLLFGWRSDVLAAMPAALEPPTVELPLWFGPNVVPVEVPALSNGRSAPSNGRAPAVERPPAAGRPPRRRLRRKNLVLALAVTVAGVGSAGGVAAAGTAEPGDPLWPIARVVNSERAESLEAREDARLALSRARRAAGAHESQRAQEYLRIAQKQADKVRTSDGRAELDAEARRLQQEIAEIDDPSTGPAGSPGTQPSPTPPIESSEPPPTSEPSEPPPSEPVDPSPSSGSPVPDPSGQPSGDRGPESGATPARLPDVAVPASIPADARGIVP